MARSISSKNPPSIFAQRLRQLRRASGLTQQKMAESLDVQRSTYAYYEIGATTPSFKTLRQIAVMYGVSVDYLIDAHGCSDEELELLSAFRRMDADTKEKILRELTLKEEPH